jgi:ATP-binding protein involved in chromosome partitioning
VPINLDDVRAALAPVKDPEIHRPLMELGMLPSISVEGGTVSITLRLTVGGCPMKQEMTESLTAAAMTVAGVTEVVITTEAMTKEQREQLRTQLTGGGENVISFNQPGNRTRIIAISSGKGGVGKSSLTANLAVAIAAEGFTVGLADMDVYGHSIPRIMGVTEPPVQVEGLLMPPAKHGVRVLSVDLMKPSGFAEPIAFRGPMLHKVLMQFMSETWWGDLDFLLMDLPPGTGDMALSIGQTLPQSEIIVVTTPHIAAAEVAVRAGALGLRMNQRLLGVIENMSAFPCPSCGELTFAFGRGGGEMVAQTLTERSGTQVPLLGAVPFDVRVSEEDGLPFILRHPESPAALAIKELARTIYVKQRGLADLTLPLVRR